MDMVKVSSSAIHSIGYDEETRKMKIKFKYGQTYTFCRVPFELYERFLNSRSKGAFYQVKIKGRFNCF